jgi:SAM-dependent methyltransferase
MRSHDHSIVGTVILFLAFACRGGRLLASRLVRAKALRDRPRLRRLIETCALRSLAAVAPPADSEPREDAVEATTSAPPGASARFARAPGITWLGVEESLASRTLFERLDEQDLAEIEELIRADPELAGIYTAAPNIEARRHLVLSYGIWLGHPAATQKTGLLTAQAPEDVHVMARGSIAAAGGLYEADMVANALVSAGVELGEVESALDFGCSSGRVVRVLAAAYPHVDWRGCDPNERAILWAAENLPGIEFFVSGDLPPLPLPDASLDMAYAISIWSHFEPSLGLHWFEEMRRILRPGGHLVITTHGLAAVGFYAQHGLRTPLQSDEIVGALYRQGGWYAPEFGEEGDWGVVNPDWGTAFLSSEWILGQLCPRWRVLEFAPGRNQENQDVYVLQRV